MIHWQGAMHPLQLRKRIFHFASALLCNRPYSSDFKCHSIQQFPVFSRCCFWNASDCFCFSFYLNTGWLWLLYKKQGGSTFFFWSSWLNQYFTNGAVQGSDFIVKYVGHLHKEKLLHMKFSLLSKMYYQWRLFKHVLSKTPFHLKRLNNVHRKSFFVLVLHQIPDLRRYFYHYPLYPYHGQCSSCSCPMKSHKSTKMSFISIWLPNPSSIAYFVRENDHNSIA